MKPCGGVNDQTSALFLTNSQRLTEGMFLGRRSVLRGKSSPSHSLNSLSWGLCLLFYERREIFKSPFDYSLCILFSNNILALIYIYLSQIFKSLLIYQPVCTNSDIP